MKTKEEIEQLAEKLYFHVDGFEEEISEGKRHYILGYTQCQEDMTDNMVKLANYLRTLDWTGQQWIDFINKHKEN
jgi:hypothetical protein